MYICIHTHEHTLSLSLSLCLSSSLIHTYTHTHTHTHTHGSKLYMEQYELSLVDDSPTKNPGVSVESGVSVVVVSLAVSLESGVSCICMYVSP